MAEDMTHPHEGLQERALREAKIAGALYAICTDVGELPDRTSPDDQPEMLLVTAEELDTICDRHIRDLLDALPQQAATDEARYRDALEQIQQATIDGKVCDDVAWFDKFTTLHDFIEETLRPSAPAAIGDLFLSTPTSQPPAAETRLREALEKIARAHDEWDPDASFASTALASVSSLAKAALTQPEPTAQPICDDSLQSMVTELGNQIHNLGCERQDDEALASRLEELRSEAWRIAGIAPTLSAQQATAQKPRPYPHAVDGMKYQETLGFEGGSLTVRTMGYGDSDGNGWFCFAEEDAEWEDGEDGKSYRIVNVPNSELIALRDKLNEVFPAQQAAGEAEAVILKGVGRINGDGWKDTTKKGEVVYVWNRTLEPPYKPGQYPRVGNEIFSATAEQYDFTPATVEEVRALFAIPQPTETQRIVAWLREDYRKEERTWRGELEYLAIAECIERGLHRAGEK